MLTIVHEMLTIDEHVAVTLGLLNIAARAGRKVMDEFRPPQAQTVVIYNVDVRRRAGRQNATAWQIIQGGGLAVEFM